MLTRCGPSGCVAKCVMRSWLLLLGAVLSCGRTEVVDDQPETGRAVDAGRDAGAVDAGRADAGVDAGGTVDAGVPFDAGLPIDGGIPFDGGPDVDGGTDAGAPFDGGPDCLGLPVEVFRVIDIPPAVFSTSIGLRFAPPTRAARVLVTSSSLLGGRVDGGAALTITGASTVCVEVAGSIIGRGGRGGSGGNGGSGSSVQSCGRAGARGGPAIFLEGAGEVVVRSGGLVAGGGGGGTGFSGCNVNAGGGGGAGLPEGEGGAGASLLSMTDELAFCGQDNGVRIGVVGESGTRDGGGVGGVARSAAPPILAGAGGALGASGGSPTGSCVFSVPMPAPAGAAVTGLGGAMRSARTLGNGRLLGVVE